MAAGDTMVGRRLPDGAHTFAAGDYAKMSDGRGWHIRPPRGHMGWLSTEPGHHTVTEHEDGTITVAPSILHKGPDCCPEGDSWHGYLERGTWREV